MTVTEFNALCGAAHDSGVAFTELKISPESLRELSADVLGFDPHALRPQASGAQVSYRTDAMVDTYRIARVDSMVDPITGECVALRVAP